MKTVIEMAREAGAIHIHKRPKEFAVVGNEAIERLVEIARADEREKYKWDVHSCGPTCTKVACVAVREAVEAEREVCAYKAGIALLGADRGLAKRVDKAIRARSNP